MNKLTLAVAGGRKTQSIVDRCASAPRGRRILVLTYTQMNQRELLARLARHRPLDAFVEVEGWFSFLLGHWVRPYLPTKFAGRRLRGLNFEGDPGRYAKDAARYLDADGRAYRRHLAHLAVETNEASAAAVVDRLSRIYDEIYVDEVQDLNGYDLEVLSTLMHSSIDLHLVGDVRQALIVTNTQDPKHKQYKGTNIKKWFDIQSAAGLVEINHQSTTWRSNQIIADFADSVFDDSWGFEKTISMNRQTTGHDGVFAIATEHVGAYVRLFRPLCLRHSIASMKNLDLRFLNIGLAKGMGVDRVLIGPTKGMVDFLQRGFKLDETPSCSLYVAVTRARASVAFVSDDPHGLGLPIWTPLSDTS
jgi:DNA helicase-2/ATP-dependent DNA helicase PcrA